MLGRVYFERASNVKYSVFLGRLPGIWCYYNKLDSPKIIILTSVATFHIVGVMKIQGTSYLRLSWINWGIGITTANQNFNNTYARQHPKP